MIRELKGAISMSNILKTMFNRSKEASQETIEEIELQEFTKAMKQKMAEQGLSHMDLANINLNKAIAGVKEEISKLEDSIEMLKSKGANDLHSVYPFIKRRQEIIETKTKRLNQLRKDFAISPDVYADATSLDNIEKHNKGVVLFLQASNEIVSVYDKFSIATRYIAEADGYVGPEFASPCNNLATIVTDLQANKRRINYKNKAEIEARFFTALKRDDEIFNHKMSVMNSLNEYATILDEPTEAISRSDMAAYEAEWDYVQQVLSEDAKRRTLEIKKP